MGKITSGERDKDGSLSDNPKILDKLRDESHKGLKEYLR